MAEVDGRLPHAFEAVEGPLDQVAASLGQHLRRHVVGEPVAGDLGPDGSNSVALADGMPIPISLIPIFTSRSEKRSFRSAFIGSIRA